MNVSFWTREEREHPPFPGEPPARGTGHNSFFTSNAAILNSSWSVYHTRVISFNSHKLGKVSEQVGQDPNTVFCYTLLLSMEWSSAKDRHRSRTLRERRRKESLPQPASKISLNPQGCSGWREQHFQAVTMSLIIVIKHLLYLDNVLNILTTLPHFISQLRIEWLPPFYDEKSKAKRN